MKNFLQRHWFVCSLLILIPCGAFWGYQDGERAVEITSVFEPRVITAIALFLMAFTLDSSQLRRSLAAPGPVVLAILLNSGLLPLLGLALKPLQTHVDFQVGLMIAVSVPCTMAAASVWTRTAEGNDAVSLLVTLITNSACVIVTPFWLRLGTGTDAELDLAQMTVRLLTAVLVPGLLGQLLRLNLAARRLATEHKKKFSDLAMAFILMLVLASSCGCGVRLRSGESLPGLGSVLIVWLSCIVLHVGVMALGIVVARRAGMKFADVVAVGFASSQKTLPIGVLLSREFASIAPFAVFPMLMFHTSQLIIDTFVAMKARAAAENVTGAKP